MRFTIKREELLKGLAVASRAVASKVAVAVLANLKIELNENGLFITGSNYDLTIKTFIPYRYGDKEIIRNYKEGATLINSKIITEIARKMESEEITLDVIDSTVAIVSDNRSEYKLNCVRPDEYPDLDLEASGTEITLSKADFDSLVSQTAFAASLKEQRPILTALNLEASEGVLTATATDSARMARKQVKIPSDVKFVANIPAKMMSEVAHLIEGLSEISIAFSDKKALFTLDRTLVASRLVAGEYPNTKNIVPKITNYSLEVNASDLLKAIDRANILSIDRENVVDLTMSESGVEISSKSSQVGSAVEKIDLFKFEGQNLRVSFNSEFVNAAVKALGSEDVTNKNPLIGIWAKNHDYADSVIDIYIDNYNGTDCYGITKNIYSYGFGQTDGAIKSKDTGFRVQILGDGIGKKLVGIGGNSLDIEGGEINLMISGEYDYIFGLTSWGWTSWTDHKIFADNGWSEILLEFASLRNLIKIFIIIMVKIYRLFIVVL